VHVRPGFVAAHRGPARTAVAGYELAFSIIGALTGSEGTWRGSGGDPFDGGYCLIAQIAGTSVARP
jgi:hypothetical protein